MSVTGRQIRAARALLDISRDDLAERCGITTMTVRNIEAELVEPQGKTLANILTAFDKEGVVFEDDEGVRICKQKLKSYSGKTGYRQLLDHIYEVAKNGGRIRQYNFGDNRYVSLADDLAMGHLRRMESIKGLDARVLAVAGEIGPPLSYCSYRTLSEAYKDTAPWYLYGDILVLPINDTGGKREFVSIHSKQVAERYIRDFDVFWNLCARGEKKRRR